jgi:hypothetical protein
MLAITTDPFEFLTALAKIGGYIYACALHMAAPSTTMRITYCRIKLPNAHESTRPKMVDAFYNDFFTENHTGLTLVLSTEEKQT